VITIFRFLKQSDIVPLGESIEELGVSIGVSARGKVEELLGRPIQIKFGIPLTLQRSWEQYLFLY
jgi:hypothetical protein